MSKNKSNVAAVTVIITTAFFVCVGESFTIPGAWAGNLDSSDSPKATGYTLGDIWNRITTNQTATEGNHGFSPLTNPGSSFHTFKEIYEAIPTVQPETVKSGSSYLGVSGTLTPSGGTADKDNVCATKTFFGSNQANWDLQTGTLTIDKNKILSGTSYCGVSGNIANVGQQTITPTITDQSIDIGYHNGNGLVAGDTDLISGNIKSGISIFGVAGDVNVVNTSSGNVTATDIRSGKIGWTDGTEITGTADIYPYGDTDSAEVLTTADADGTYNATNLNAGTVKDGTVFGVSQTGDYPSATYPLDGDTGASDATATEICEDYEAWKKTGGLLTGTLAPEARTIGSGNTICGVNGTLLKDQVNGSAGNLVADYALYTEANGGVDDYNNNKTSGGLGVLPEGSYSSEWTDCATGDNCGLTGADVALADRKDNDTNLIWSKWLESGAYKSWFWANNCYAPGAVQNLGACSANDDNACQCVKITEGIKTGCESIGDGQWRLPYQKELMQAYINGSWGNLSSAGRLLVGYHAIRCYAVRLAHGLVHRLHVRQC